MDLTEAEAAHLRAKLDALRVKASANGAADSRWDIIATGESVLKGGSAWPYGNARAAFDAIMEAT
ncbi:hypothetical protein [Limimaricola cinnabarinus]|uniref:hypothetical protein n=1 Tax=Limimaricola cinnabarinus TaxID=1125964 RepID=UPI0024903FEB|nr:hypothetical protein [Limimaricola cinnabarinus]